MKIPRPSLRPFLNLALAAALTAATAAAAGCYTGSATDVNHLPPDQTGIDATEPVKAVDGGAKGQKNKTAVGLPCDIAAIVANACADCHGAVPSGGARNRLVTYEDFAAAQNGDPKKTAAKASLARMKSDDRSMPPTGKLADDTIAVFERWVTAGLPRGTCGSAPADPVAVQEPEPAPVDAGAPPPPPPVSVCTSGVTAPRHPDPPELMNPGKACISCHLTKEGVVKFEIAGTVYPTMHEPDGCNGAADAKVLIIDRTGNIHELPTNAAGNFMTDEAFPKPYRAMIVHGSEIKLMKTPQMNGDCNSCHTEWGNGAPGRILAP